MTVDVKSGSSLSDFLAEVQKAKTVAVSDITGSAFTMVNAGTGTTVNDNDPLVRYTGVLSQKEDDPTYINIPVDRLVARFTHAVASDFSDESAGFSADAVVNGVAMNATNKTTLGYSLINKITNTTYNTDYRQDANMSIAAESFASVGGDGEKLETAIELNWLDNNDDNTNAFLAAGSYEYVLENTTNASHHDYNNLTQALVKATFTPTELEITTGTSWFVINIEGTGRVPMTLADVQSFYAGEYLVGGVTKFATSSETKTAMATQLAHILESYTGSTTVSNMSWADVTLEVLDAIANGGYVAATVADEANCIVQYFQGGVNYYDIFIQHDSDMEVGELGRWGMVRNNAYTLTISKLTAPGLPYIPDPTDPDIKDPQNPDPSNPEPADPEDAYIVATINVNPWTIWTQSADLN